MTSRAFGPLTRQVLDYVEERGPVTSIDIREGLRLPCSVANIHSMLQTLAHRELIRRCGTQAHPGEPPRVLWCSPTQRVEIPEIREDCQHCGGKGRRAHVSGRMVCGWCFR